MSDTPPPHPLRRCVEFFVSTRKSIPRDRTTHVVFLVLALTVTILPFFLTARPDDPETLTCAGLVLPGRCLSKALFHVPCPGCGLTHSFVYLAQGRPRESLRWHRIGAILYAYFVYQVFFRIAILRRPQRIEAPVWIDVQHYAALGVIALLFLNWIAGAWCGGNGM